LIQDKFWNATRFLIFRWRSGFYAMRISPESGDLPNEIAGRVCRIDLRRSLAGY
jgi:hypothetical protein